MVMAVTAVLTSCKKDNDVIALRATISDYRDTGKDGKTYIETINNVDWVSWNDYDKVLINGIQRTVRVLESGNGRYATIKGVAYVTPNENNPSVGYYAVYPAERVLTNPSTGFPQILLPQVQNYVPVTVNGQTVQKVEAPMAAFCQANSTQVGLDFTNLCALLKIQFSSAMEIAAITVSSTSTPLWGKATISGTDAPTLSTPSLEGLNTTDNTVTLDCTNNGTAAGGVRSSGPFYVVLPPATNVDNLTINIYKFNSNSTNPITLYTRTAGNQININAGYIYNHGELGDFSQSGISVIPYPGLGIGEFSVNENKKVRFSLGNLQYKAKTKTWRIALNQWDFVGNSTNGISGNNASISQTNNNWIDLFGYGTSGVAHNGYTYYPYTSTDITSDYASVTIQNTNHDWGVNMISNGGNQPNKWRTLTKDEFNYLLNERSNSNQLRHINCQVNGINGVKGMIILPDNFPINQSPYNTSSWQWGFLSSTQWNRVAALGAIFLPITGYRINTDLYTFYENSSSNSKGYYWTSQYDSDRSIAYYWKFDSNNSSGSFGDAYTYMGYAVRLVRDVN